MGALRQFVERLKKGDVKLNAAADDGGGAAAPAAGAAPVPATVLQSIVIEAEDLLLIVGQKTHFQAFGRFADGHTSIMTTEVVWTCSPSGAAEIDFTGLATAHVRGNLTITATAANNPAVTASIDVTMRQAGVLESIEILPEDITFVVGQKLKLTALGHYSDGSTKEITTKVTWSSSSADVIVIDNSGVATPLAGADDVTITAADPGNPDVSASAQATVEEGEPSALTPEQQEDVKREAFADMGEAVRNDPPDEARDRRFASQINRGSDALNKKPPDKAALKQLIDVGGAKALDSLIKNLPDPPDRAAVTAAIEARFKIKMTDIDVDADEGAEGSKSIKLIYMTLLKVPERNVRENKSLNEIIRQPGDGGAYYDPERKQAVFSAERADDEMDEIGNTTPTDITRDDGTVIRLLAELIDVEDDCKPKAGFKKPPRLSWNTLHEVGHGVDDETKAMDEEKGNDFAGWEYPDIDTVTKKAAEVLHYDQDFIKELLTNSNPDAFLKAQDATADEQKAAVAWCKAVRVESELWQKGEDSKKYALNGRVFHEAYPGLWVSYNLDARKKGITGYQFRAPGEWFAELYAAYYSGALKDNHPYAAFIKKF